MDRGCATAAGGDMSALMSPTLARVYIQQGYLDKAEAMLAALLARDPDDGRARVLYNRLRRRPRAEVEAEDGGHQTVLVRWREAQATPERPLHIIATTFAREQPKHLFVTSCMCTTKQGERALSTGPYLGSVAVGLVRPEYDRDGKLRLIPLTVAKPLIPRVSRTRRR